MSSKTTKYFQTNSFIYRAILFDRIIKKKTIDLFHKYKQNTVSSTERKIGFR